MQFLVSFLLQKFKKLPTWEEIIAIFVKTDGHHSVRKVKGLLHPISVVHVDVYVQNSRVILEQFQNADDDVVDVAKARRFKFLGVVQSPRPINGDITVVVVEFHSSLQGSARVHRTEVEKAVEYRTVVPDVVVAEMLCESLDVLRRDSL